MSRMDAEYIARRLREEQTAAVAAGDPRVAASHAGMASRYEAAMKALAEQGPQGSR